MPQLMKLKAVKSEEGKMQNYKDFKNKLLKDKATKKAYDELELGFALLAGALNAKLRVSIL